MKKIIFIVVIVFVGVWMGINIARDAPLFSNPFADKEFREKAEQKIGSFITKPKKALEDKLPGSD